MTRPSERFEARRLSPENDMNSAHAEPNALLISRDLFFTTKVTGTATELGFRVAVQGDIDDLASKLVGSSYRCLIVDLALSGVRVADVTGALPAENRPAVIAFGSHVMTARLNEAREAGCDEVLPRSVFSATLPQILTRYLGAP